jgi:hypothetical protein
MSWDVAVQVTVSVVTIVVTAGATAWFSIRANVRQHVWQKIFEAKWQTIQEFSQALDEFSRLAMWMHNSVLAWKEPDKQRGFVILYGLFEAAWPQHRRPPMVAQVMGSMPPPGPNATRETLERFLVGYRNLLVQDLVHVHERITTGFSRLALTGFDPRVAKDMDLLTLKWANRFSNAQLPYEELDFASFFSEWKALSRLTKLRLRQDLAFSARSLRRSLRVKDEWRKHVESTTLPKLE